MDNPWARGGAGADWTVGKLPIQIYQKKGKKKGKKKDKKEKKGKKTTNSNKNKETQENI